MSEFKGKKTLVTGASQGIGREIVHALIKKGATVYGLATKELLLEELQNMFPGSFVPIVCDLSSPESALRESITPHLPFDYLVNNAGIAILERCGSITEEVLDKTFAVNVKAPLLLSKMVAESMVENDIKGAIVNVSSQASLKPLVDHAVYCSSKAALDMLTRCFAMEYGPKGIRVNAVNPTVVMTDMGKKNWSDQAKAQEMLDKMSIKNFAEPSDVVSAVLFLLSSDSRMTTGHAFPIDGGFTTR